MRNNGKLMRASFVLLVLTLITSCFVGGTFAKYVSERTGDDTARVAKWGVVITADGQAIKKEYAADNNDPHDIGISVKSEDIVVAPGTSGTFRGVSLSGIPEVAVNIDTKVELELENWEVNGQYYCPLNFNVNGVRKNGSDYSSEAEFMADFNERVSEAASGVVDAGEDLATSSKLPAVLKNGQNGISWKWEYESGDDDKDTALGDAAANGTNVPTISLTMTTTVTQID